MKSNILSFSIVLMLIASAITTSAQAQDVKAWSTAGSTGTADKVDLNKIVYSNGIVAFPEIPGTQLSVGRVSLQLQTVQAVIRYNVTATDGLFFDSGPLCMVVRFRDNGNRARVFLRLLKLNLEDGTTATVLTFDSNSFAPKADFQANSVATTSRAPFDFSHNAYYVEATLTKQQPIATSIGGGKPGLAVVVLKQCNPIT